MTFVVVPHGGSGDLSTRSYEISYRALRRLMVAGITVGVALFLMAASWLWMSAQVAEIPLLRRQVAELQKERQERERLARTLARMQATYDQVREILKGDLPPADSIEARARAAGGRLRGDTGFVRPDTTANDTAAEGPQAMLPHAWPLQDVAFVTRGVEAGPGGHPGLDIAVTAGSPILASGGGTVEAAGMDRVYGEYVLIAHAGGFESLYGHASRLLVRPRERVRAAQVIALSGSTGESTAPHLHFEIRKDGRPVDPRPLVGSGGG